MKKSLILLLSGIFAISLCGCSNNSDSSSSSESSSSGSSSSSSSESSTESSESSSSSAESSASSDVKQEEVTNIVGLAGDIVESGDITSFKVDFEDVSEFSMEEFLGAEYAEADCGGFAYVADYSGKSYTDRDNADIYNESDMTFNGVPDEKITKFKRINVGDKINGLTVKSAQSNFRNMGDSAVYTLPDGGEGGTLEAAKYLPEVFFNYCEAEFDGDMELTGYLAIAGEDDYGIETGDIRFVPSGDCALPVMSLSFRDFEFFSERYVSSEYDLTWSDVYPVISLGNVSSVTADLSGIPERNSYVKVKITITNIKMAGYPDWINTVSAEIKDIERV